MENEKRALTCVYCGMAYPQNTPTWGKKVLTDHIKICEKHTLRQAEKRILKLRKALIGLIGVETKEELEQMEAAIRIMPVPDIDRMKTINAIAALLEDLEDRK